MTGRLERNALASVVGTVWSIGLGLVCLPILMRLLGAEAFGLTGVYLTLQSIFVLFDLGIAPTLNREIARLDARQRLRRQRDLVLTLQAVYWLVALVGGIAICALAPVVAGRWVRIQSLSVETVQACIRMMGVTLALQFPFGLYHAALLGRQRHVLFNAVTIVLATLRGIGPLLLLWLVAPTPQLYFAAQIAVSTAGTATIALLTWRSLPRDGGRAAVFRPALIRRVWRFSAAYSVNALANLLLLQGDNIVLSTLLPLRMFGYYTLAQRLGSGLYALIVAGSTAIFPQFSGAVVRDDAAELTDVYHRACQLMSVLVIPAAVVVAVFAPEVLLLWTGDPVTVAHTHVVLALVAAGMLLHGIVQAPCYLQVAHGWWRLIAISKGLLVVTILPLYAVMGARFGGPGAAAVWVLLNVCYLATLPAMHRRFLHGELPRWMRDDVGLPLAAALVTAAAARWLVPAQLARPALLAYLLATGVLTTLATAATLPGVRRLAVPYLRRRLMPDAA